MGSGTFFRTHWSSHRSWVEIIWKKGWERKKETEKVSVRGRGTGSFGRCKVLKSPQFALCPNAMSCRRAGQSLLQQSAVNGIIQERSGVTLLTRGDGEHVRFHYHRGENSPFVSLHQHRCEVISREKSIGGMNVENMRQLQFSGIKKCMMLHFLVIH